MKPVFLFFLVLTSVIFIRCSKTHDDCLEDECKLIPPPTERTLKGFILFSWHEDGVWHYALAPNLNAFRAQINDGTTVGGLECLKQNLDRFPENEEIGWITCGDEVTGEGNTITLSCPPESVIHELSDYCNNLNLELTIFND